MKKELEGKKLDERLVDGAVGGTGYADWNEDKDDDYDIWDPLKHGLPPEPFPQRRTHNQITNDPNC